uniref:Uncharacterized protein n=1 Tax=Plectus sambesii TaxID=2011161 RepID=A0A914VDK3_9BILA
MSTDPSPTPPNGLQLLSQASAITHQVQLTVPALSSSGYGNQHASSAHGGSAGTHAQSPAVMGHGPPNMSIPHNPQQHQQQQQFVQPLTQPAPPPPPKPKRQRPPKRKPPSSAVGPPAQAAAPSPAKVSKPKISPAVLKQRLEDEVFTRKMYFLKRTIKALVFKNAALCDEVARLNQRIHTVTEER